MKKNFYIQPTMAQMPVAPQTIVCVSVGGGGNAPEQGIPGDAPLRQFSGDSQGLKYLI